MKKIVKFEFSIYVVSYRIAASCLRYVRVDDVQCRAYVMGNQPFGHNRSGRKLGGGGAVPPFWVRESWVPIMAWPEAHLHTKCHFDPSSRLATIDIGRKLGRGSGPFFGEGELGPRLTQLACAEAYLHTKWHFNPSSCSATTDMGRKLGGCAPFREGRWVPI